MWKINIPASTLVCIPEGTRQFTAALTAIRDKPVCWIGISGAFRTRFPRGCWNLSCKAYQIIAGHISSPRRTAAGSGRSIYEYAQEKGGTKTWDKNKYASCPLPRMRTEDYGCMDRYEDAVHYPYSRSVSWFYDKVQTLRRGNWGNKNWIETPTAPCIYKNIDSVINILYNIINMLCFKESNKIKTKKML